MPNLKFDAEFWAAAGPVIAIRPPGQPRTAQQLRARLNVGLASLAKGDLPEDIVETRHQVTSFDGEQIAVYRYAKKEDTDSKKQPAFVYVHGGGLVGGDIDPYSRLLAARCAAEAGVQMFAVEYRLAPEFPYPTPAEDCYAALRWLSEGAEGLGLDAARLGFYALSAGGGLAVAATLMARDRGLSPPLAKQILIYPMLDDRTRAERGDPLCDFLTWTNVQNQLGWNAYLGEGRPGSDDVPAYAAPGRVEDVAGLPSTYIDVGGLDLFCAESVAFAGRLSKANVQMELHVYSGLPHIFDLYAPDIELTRRARENRLRAARSL
ncbi:arylesterase monooxygenase [Colletotrichum plurivorum]|uniref:Arylesterase monooxygenase n=1 Tax=Colletotrichum plurivorum TaxID=2175906 RepID=A0A8H6KHY3_9PEZI|nr:arylesterase monooxygenase [Colletotrichum plurivorum]